MDMLHRARLGTEKTPQWIWLSPNEVPRGFVRSDHCRYNELKELMPGSAARFPELPPDSYILGTTEAVRLDVVDACVRSQLIVRPLREYFTGI